MNFKQHINHRMQFVIDYAKQQGRMRKKGDVLIGSKREISTCSYFWIFFTKKGLKKKRKRPVALKKKRTKRKVTESQNHRVGLKRGC